MILKNKHITLPLLILSVLLFMISCSEKPKEVLSKSEMTDFLVDLHKLDGTLAVKNMGSAQDRENLYYYNALLKKHGITEAAFDSSLIWYSKDPKRFEKIYSEVVIRLMEMDSLQKVESKNMEKNLLYKEMSYNLWSGTTRFDLQQDSVNRYDFCIRYQDFYEKDIYKLSMLVKSSGTVKNQFIAIRIYYQDGKIDSVRTNVPADNLRKRYTLKIKAKRSERIDSIAGSICRTTDKSARFKTSVDSISLLRVYVPAVQDSINFAKRRKAAAEIPDSIIRKLPSPRVRVLEFKKPPAEAPLMPRPSYLQ